MRTKFTALVLSTLIAGATALGLTTGPASASPCQIPGGKTYYAGNNRQGCARVDVTYCLYDTTGYWVSWWVQDTVDPYEDYDRSEIWWKLPAHSQFYRLAYDTDSADWEYSTWYVGVLHTYREGAGGQARFEFRFSDKWEAQTISPNYLTTTIC